MSIERPGCKMSVEIIQQKPPQSDEATALQDVFDRQRKAFDGDRYPAASVRLERLTRLRKVIVDGRQSIIEALCSDFGHRCSEESRVAEIAGTIATLDHVIANFRKWMRPRGRSTGFWFVPGTSRIVPQP